MTLNNLRNLVDLAAGIALGTIIGGLVGVLLVRLA